MSAAVAAQAIVVGWQRTAPNSEFRLAPLSDGGPGFAAAMAGARDVELRQSWVRGPLGTEVLAGWALDKDTAFIESASACGLSLLTEDQRNPAVTSTFGVGQLIREAIELGARHIMVGLGGSSTNDAGMGALAALGVKAFDEAGADVTFLLESGGLGLRAIAQIDLTAATALLEHVTIEIATDVDNPFLGSRGATNEYAPQKGADLALVMQLEGSMQHVANILGRRADGKDPAVALGAGSAGGLGYGLLVLGASRSAGISRIMQASGFSEHLDWADLVITGEGSFDWQSLRGKVVTGVSMAALNLGKPVVVLAGQVSIGRREWTTIGVSGAYAMQDIVDEELCWSDPTGSLATAAARVARTWAV